VLSGSSAATKSGGRNLRKERSRERENEKVGLEEERGDEEEKKTLEAGYYRLVRRWRRQLLSI